MRRILAAAAAAAVALTTLAATPAAAAAATATTTAAAPSKLDGVRLLLNDFALTDGGYGPADPAGCAVGGSSTFAMNGSGSVESGSPYHPGTFTMTGSVTIGAQAPDNSLYGFPAKSADITSWSQTYKIQSGGRTIDITTTLSPTPYSFTPNKATCYGDAGDGPGGTSLFGWADAYSGSMKAVQATTAYSAKITDSSGTWSSTGTATTRLRELRGLLPAPWNQQGSHTPQVSNFYGGTTPAPPVVDTDGDTVPDGSDNCPSAANPAQSDGDGDGTGDACDPTDNRDADGDGVLDGSDNCPNAPNAGQSDVDGDGIGDACDSTDGRDGDGDGVPNVSDNCPAAANPDQQDTDGDGQGDVCDADIDGDGLSNVIEIWLGCNPHLADSDGDGVGDWVEVVISRTSPVLVDTHADPDEGGDYGYLLRIIKLKCGCLPPTDDPSGSGFRSWVEHWYFGGSYDPDVHGGGGYTSLIEYIWHLCGCGPDDPDGNGIPGTVEHHYGSGGLLWIIHKCGCLPWEISGGGSGGGIRTELIGGGLSTQDSDGDGIPDAIEIVIGCNPHKADSDGDGLDDRQELLFGSDPTKADTDGDGMNDKREYDLGCDPRNPDSDGDGHPDGSDPAPRGGIIEGSCKPSVDAAVVPVGTSITVSTTFIGHDDGVATGHIDWDDGGTSTSRTGAGVLTGTRTFTKPGVYTIGCRVIDVNGATQTTTTQVVVYDPSAGFVTGGGWIDSPAGAYRPDPSVKGPARFGFVSQYKKGATVPTGQTEFQLQTAGMNFHAGVYDWLVVTGASTRAQYKGTGTINGSGSYGFLLTAYDLGSGQNVDKLRIKIWDKGTGAVVYDNRLGSPDDVDTADPQLLSQGQIVIHKGGGK